jgi:hypothetical protein
MINFHVSANFRGAWEVWNHFMSVQHGQIATLLKLIDRAGQGRLIVAGDSNVIYGGQLYRMLVEGAGLTDPFDDAPTYFTRKHGSGAIDRLLLRGWGDCPATTTHLLAGQAVFPPNAKRGSWTDHEGLRLTV